MNREMILKVADAIEASAKPETAPPLGFNMRTYIGAAADCADDKTGHSCGTVACMAGWAMLVAGYTVDEIAEIDAADFNVDAYDVPFRAQNILGLGDQVASDLFHPPTRMSTWADIAPTQAVAVLRHLAETGEVNWSLSKAEGLSAGVEEGR